MKEKPTFLLGKRASLGILACLVVAFAIFGTYSLKGSQKGEPGTTNENSNLSASTEKLVIDTEEDEEQAQDDVSEEGSSPDDVSEQSAGEAVSLNFTEDSQLLWPVEGTILMNYSMDKTTYFATLDQYKYNPATIIQGAEGNQVIAGAPGIVKSIDVTAQTGTTVNLDLGNGYELLIGQLKEVPVNAGDYVDATTVIGYVSAPTKYYAKEGSNVYYEMRKDGQAVDAVNYVEAE